MLTAVAGENTAWDAGMANENSNESNNINDSNRDLINNSWE